LTDCISVSKQSKKSVGLELVNLSISYVDEHIYYPVKITQHFFFFVTIKTHVSTSRNFSDFGVYFSSLLTILQMLSVKKNSYDV
jgi:hypothetical protein